MTDQRGATADDTITVRCVCGWETTGPTEDVVAATSDHGKRIHNMTATREQILAMAVAASPEHG
jgi:predicted small metal-binding protein